MGKYRSYVCCHLFRILIPSLLSSKSRAYCWCRSEILISLYSQISIMINYFYTSWRHYMNALSHPSYYLACEYR